MLLVNPPPHRAVAILAFGLAGCAMHPGPDVALETQREVAPAPGDGAVPITPAIATPGPQPHLSPILEPAHAASASYLTVLAQAGLTGVWKLYVPHRLDVSLRGGFAYGRVAMHLCRIVQHGPDISGNCLLDRVSPVYGTVQGDHFTLRLNGLNFSGRMQGWNRLQGEFVLRILGIGVTPPLPAAAERRVGAATTLPEAGAEASVRSAIDDAVSGNLRPGQYTEAGARRAAAELQVLQPAFRHLGPLEAMSYVDSQELIGPKGEKLGDMQVFAADFAQGTRLCGISLAPDGRINRFMCG